MAATVELSTPPLIATATVQVSAEVSATPFLEARFGAAISYWCKGAQAGVPVPLEADWEICAHWDWGASALCTSARACATELLDESTSWAGWVVGAQALRSSG